MTRDHIEGLVITAIGPRMNRQGARWNAKPSGSGEYFQVLDEELDTLNRGHLRQFQDELRTEMHLLKRQISRRRNPSPMNRQNIKSAGKHEGQKGARQ